MPVVSVTDPHAGTSRVTLEAGGSLMDGLKDAGVDIAAICGGACSCGTCHVHVAPEWRSALPPAQDAERELLCELADYQPDRSRLACQIPVTDALDGLMVGLVP